MSGRAGRKIYVGNLPIDVRVHDIKDSFYKYGHIVRVELKAPPRTQGYCFIEFESSLDAEKAIKGHDGYDFDGCHLKVEPAREGRRFSSSDGRSSRDGGEANKYGVSHRSEYRVVVSGLPSSTRWQDLKDYMRKAGDVCFAQVFQNGDGTMGIVHYTNYDDMKYAVRKLDGTEFRNASPKSYIRLHSQRRSKLDHSRLKDLVYVKYNKALIWIFNHRDVIDLISLTEIDDVNEWLTGKLDDESDEENDLIVGEEDLTWINVAKATGVYDKRYNIRERSKGKDKESSFRHDIVIKNKDEEGDEKDYEIGDDADEIMKLF